MQGEYWTHSCEDLTGVHQVITMTQPKEIILHKTAPYIKELAESLKTQPHTVVSYRDMLDSSSEFITSMLNIQSLSSFGQALADARDIPFSLLLHYLHTTQQKDISTVYRVSRYRPHDFVLLDEVSIKNLELFQSSYDQSSQYSLFGVLNTCQTSAGSKLLKYMLAHPLKNSTHIHERQHHIAQWVENRDHAQAISDLLKGLYDLPRLLTNIVYKKPHYQSFQRLRTTLHTLLLSGTGTGCQAELLALNQ